MKRFLLLLSLAASAALAQVTIPWTDVDKTGSSLADFGTRSASDLNSGTLPAARLPAFTGDATASVGTGNLSLATVNSNVGSFGSGTQIPVVTINGKGLITGASVTTVTPAWSNVTGKPTTVATSGLTDAVANTRTISTTAPLTGGGDLSANRTLTVSAASTSATGVVQLAGDTLAAAGTSEAVVPTVEDAARLVSVGYGYQLGFRNDLVGLPNRAGVQAFNQWIGETPNGLNVTKNITVGERRNLWQYTENYSHATYGGNNVTKGTDTIVVDGITLTKATTTNGFYSSIFSSVTGLGLTPYVAGEYYIASMFVLSASDREQWPGNARGALGGPGNDTSNCYERKLIIPGKLCRVWWLVRATSTTAADGGGLGSVAYGSGSASTNLGWLGSSYPDGSSGANNLMTLYVGGFQLERVNSDGKYGIIGIGDSTMAGGSGGNDSATSLEWMAMLGAHLNVHAFNRGVGGNQTTVMDSRWGTDVTPLKNRAKYVVIQPSAANDIPNGVSLATTQGAVNSMIAKAATDGLIPVLVVPPSSSAINANSGYRTTYDQLCTWIRQTFPLVIDNAKVANDPWNPYQLRRATLWEGDGTHWGTAASRAIAANAAAYPWWDFPRPSAYQPIATTSYTAPSISGSGAGMTGILSVNVVNVSAGNVAATTNQAAINELDTEKERKALTTTAALDFPSIAAASQADLTITVTGAAVGDAVAPGLPAAPTAGIVYNVFVSATNTVTVRATNITAGAIDPASATFRATVLQP